MTDCDGFSYYFYHCMISRPCSKFNVRKSETKKLRKALKAYDDTQTTFLELYRKKVADAEFDFFCLSPNGGIFDL